MKAQPIKCTEVDGKTLVIKCSIDECTHIDLSLPGPIGHLHIPIIVGMNKTRRGINCWSWNGDTERPTLKPSIMNDFRPHDPLVNHIFITDGQVIFLSDCTHEFKGQTVDLLDVED